jgi:hypothetical protein
MAGLLMNDHQAKLVEQLRTLKTEAPSAPWQYVGFIHVGGLEALGYGEASDLLLIISSSGRSVVDCFSGDKLIRDYESDWETWYQPFQLIAEGCGPLSGQTIRLAGIAGGGLPTVTADGWSLELVAPDWPNNFVLLDAPQGLGAQHIYETAQKVAPKHGLPDVITVYGFSPTGKSFVVARSDGAEIFSRDATSEQTEP